jgi:branched-chain amino acid transport system substrate-binding protein
MRLRLRVVAAGAVGLATLAASACGGANGSSGGGSTGGADVHLGVLRPFTGKYASVGAAAREGALTAQAAINDAGGILGGKLLVDSADTLGDPADAVPALNHLLSVSNVVGIIGPGGAEVKSVQPILDRNHIPFMFGGGSTTFDKNSDPYFWRVTPSDSQLGVAMAVYAYKKGYRKAAMMFSTIESAQTLKDPVKATFEKLGGTIVATADISPSQLSYRSEVLNIHNANPDVIFTQMEPATGSVVLSNFKELGGLIPMVGSDILSGADFITAVTPATAHQAIVAVVGSSTPGPGTTTFSTYFSKLYPGQQPPGGANYAYDATVVLALAIQAAGSTDSAKIEAAIPQVANGPGTVVTDFKSGLAALKAGQKINYEGASGPMDFNQYHNVFGPFDVVQSDGGSGMTTVQTISPADLAAAA